MKMKIAGLVAVIALLAGPVSAQTQPHVQGPGEPDKAKTPAEIAAEKDTERAYKRSLGSIPEQKSVDPWGIARGDSAPPKNISKNTDKAAAKAAPVKPKPKTDLTTGSKTDTTPRP